MGIVLVHADFLKTFMRICKGCELLDLLNKLNDTQRKTIKKQQQAIKTLSENRQLKIEFVQN